MNNKKKIKNIVSNDYDVVLSFCPPAFSGLFARDIIRQNNLGKIRHIQFWTDP